MQRARLFVMLLVVVVLVVPAGSAGAVPGPVFTETPRVSVGSGAVDEGHMGGRWIRFTISLSWHTTVPVTFTVATSDVSATAGVDYVAKTKTLTFLPGQTQKYLTIGIRQDFQDEADETFALSLSNVVNATIGVGTGTGTIYDDDPSPGPRATVGDISLVETCSGTPIRAYVPIVLSQRRNVPVVVQATTVPVDATADVDYFSLTKTITFFAGNSVRPFPVRIKTDVLPEGTEQLEVHVSIVSGDVTMGKSIGTITIANCIAPS
ncbi:MAG TPA: Calx-beta domain-containing protein [Acidimicrobiia bacterium]|nr:Calx-beta domain-containing protein [Acidimicrobiia bacterium]